MKQDCLKFLGRLCVALPGVLFLHVAPAQTQPLTHYGHFKHMVRSGDTSAKIPLASLDTDHGTWGMGALAGLRGEIIQVDSQILVSRGSATDGHTTPPTPDDGATLWVGGKVTDWVSVRVPSDMTQGQFEVFVQAQANARSTDAAQPFMFRVTGAFPDLVWHVVTGEPQGSAANAPEGPVPQARHLGHSNQHAQGAHTNHRTGMRLFRNPTAEGQLVGIYSGAALEGVVTQAGERFHVHYIDHQRTVSGHVDAYRVRENAVLWLPFTP